MTRLPFRLGRWSAFVVVAGALLFVLAGGWDRWRVAYAAVLAACTLVATLAIDPELVRERLRRGQPGVDPGRLIVIRLLFLTQVVVSPLDAGRFHWTVPVPAGLRFASLIMMAAAILGVVWAMSANRFFLPVIRLQSERGHRVVDAGPYRFVRHPGYVGMALAAAAGPLALGSWLGFGIGIVLALLFVWRAADEDRFLGGRLEGYDAYRQRVRWRMVPGAW